MVQIGSESFLTGVSSVMNVVNDKVSTFKLKLAQSRKENSVCKDKIESMRKVIQNYREMQAKSVCTQCMNELNDKSSKAQKVASNLINTR